MELLRHLSPLQGMIEPARRSAVLYHYPCPDGAFAALAAHLYFKAQSLPTVFIPNTVYNPVRPENIPFRDVEDVYLLDFIGPPEFVAKISSKAKRVIILDHHKTAVEELSRDDHQKLSNVTMVIDMKRSGATIAYDFFRDKLLKESMVSDHDAINANTLGGLIEENEIGRVSRLFKLVEDGDLWRWEIPDSKAFHWGLKDMNIEFNVNRNPSVFDQLLKLDPDSVICRGKDIIHRNQRLIKDTVDRSFEVSLGAGLFGLCLAVNADGMSDLRSDIGHQLAEKSQCLGLRGIGAVVYKVAELGNDQLLKVSLRSVGSEDTTPISQAFGGGGHRNASAFMVDASIFDMWKAPAESD
ncbi:DHHA1 domain protein [Wolffia australiana]